MSNVDEVTNRFIKEVNEKGMEHVLTWISGWYKQFAAAKLEDRIQDVHGLEKPLKKMSHSDLDAIRALVCMEQIPHLASSIDNHSTGQGTNMLNQATLAASVETLNRIHGYSLRQYRDNIADQARAVFDRVSQQEAQGPGERGG